MSEMRNKIDGEDKAVLIGIIAVVSLMVGLCIGLTIFSHSGDLARQKTLQTKIHACEKSSDIKTCIALVAPPR